MSGTKKRIVTEEDLKTNPDLVAQGINVGDEIEIPDPSQESSPKTDGKKKSKQPHTNNKSGKKDIGKGKIRKINTKDSGGGEDTIFRVALTISRIVEVPAPNKHDVFEILKEMKIGEFINRDNVSLLGR
ncbi:MAG: hypothetical protein HGGPFJEG_03063 [Ignavibacteria bacterium]|nr:hypothetical protein [Ignavibacteria bacterium]